LGFGGRKLFCHEGDAGLRLLAAAFRNSVCLDVSSLDPEVELFVKFLPFIRYRLVKILLRAINLLAESSGPLIERF
jgi:hypothetical protein